MSDHYRSHKIVGSEADQPRPMAYMRSGRRNGTFSSRGMAFLLVLALVALAAMAATVLPH